MNKTDNKYFNVGFYKILNEGTLAMWGEGEDKGGRRGGEGPASREGI